MSNLKPYRVGPNPRRYDGDRATYPGNASVNEGDIVYIDPDRGPDADGEVRLRRDSNKSSYFSWIMARDVTPIEDESEFIKIKRSDLPDVVDSGCDWEASHPDSGGTWANKKITTAANLRGRAMECLALAEFIEANPPVDEAQVEAFAAIIRERYAETGSVTRYPTEDSLARRLVERGARIEVTP